MRNFLVFSGIGIELAGMMFVAVVVGGQMDKKFGTNGLIFLVMAMLFLIGWFVHIVYLLRRMNSKNDSESRKD